ncbi:MAG: hypothetical protein OXH52_06610 [Gammaproteobacteria bacterium]|nr:hypothetical protein [Gammaproteobacteria bacterium]
MNPSTVSTPMRHRMTVVRLGLLPVAVAFAVFGCTGANVVVNTVVPSPLVEPLPLRVGVFFDESLRGYVHEETVEDHGDFRIELGSVQVPVFERAFDALFEETVALSSMEATDGVAAVIVPVFEELQFSIPAQTRGQFFEVWIKYRIDVFGSDGELLTSWALPAYGKSNERNFGFMEDSKGSGLTEASVWALRDAAAHLSLYFPRVPEIAELVQGGQG